eukprot:TRINITY_DN13720_c0_g1_i3.p1 TRINITY_DN13720_c0_g1~~TRINITY_DN13720_c0_g1_i3.p1  ORF type:complete len:367 (-),score=-20.48 TRINITY_DN13720_c0_g1_i3:37-1137(-)
MYHIFHKLILVSIIKVSKLTKEIQFKTVNSVQNNNYFLYLFFIEVFTTKVTQVFSVCSPQRIYYRSICTQSFSFYFLIFLNFLQLQLKYQIKSQIVLEYNALLLQFYEFQIKEKNNIYNHQNLTLFVHSIPSTGISHFTNSQQRKYFKQLIFTQRIKQMQFNTKDKIDSFGLPGRNRLLFSLQQFNLFLGPLWLQRRIQEQRQSNGNVLIESIPIQTMYVLLSVLEWEENQVWIENVRIICSECSFGFSVRFEKFLQIFLRFLDKCTITIRFFRANQLVPRLKSRIKFFWAPCQQLVYLHKLIRLMLLLWENFVYKVVVSLSFISQGQSLRRGTFLLIFFQSHIMSEFGTSRQICLIVYSSCIEHC